MSFFIISYIKAIMIRWTQRWEGENWNALTLHWCSLDWSGLYFLLNGNFWAILNHLPLVRFFLAQTDMVLWHSWHNSNKIIPLTSRIIFCSHLFTCFCMGLQTSGQPDMLKWRQHLGASGLYLASKWRHTQAIKSRLISTLNWII